MKANDLHASKLCYIEAINRLVPGFETLAVLDDNARLPLKKEISIIFSNLSLVNLRLDCVQEAYDNAHQSIAFNPTAKVQCFKMYLSK